MANLSALLGLELLEDFPELAMALNRPEWHARAACRGMDTELFFLERGQPAAPARAICSTCPVAAQCHAAAIEMDDVGIWAGTSPAERRRASAA
jgi:WhiB family redox-sensing transcriptional regulator